MCFGRWTNCAILLMGLTLMTPFFAHAWRGHFRGGPVIVHGWSGGYWYHGPYMGRVGWWWVVGPGWYYYPEPMYPYPDEASPVYYMQGATAAPPPVPGTTPPPPVGTTAQSPPKGTARATSYYCEKSKAYYPIVNSCEGGWVATPVQPPGE